MRWLAIDASGEISVVPGATTRRGAPGGIRRGDEVWAAARLGDGEHHGIGQVRRGQ